MWFESHSVLGWLRYDISCSQFFFAHYTLPSAQTSIHIFSQHFSHKFTDTLCRYFNSFCFVVVQVYQLHSSSIVELTSTIQERPISDPATRKFFSLRSLNLSKVESAGALHLSPVGARGAAHPPLVVPHPHHHICNPSGHVCSEIFPIIHFHTGRPIPYQFLLPHRANNGKREFAQL